jgi:AraC family transcriptional regulator, arabinose operon regulatory protein
VLPGPLVRSSLLRPVTRRLLVTDAGYFPHAATHGRVRPNGAKQTIVILCIQWAGWFEVDGSRAAVREGQALVIPKGVPHSYGADAQRPWTIWFLHAAGDDVDDFTEMVCGADGAPAVVDVRDVHSAAAFIEAAVRSMESDETHASLYEAAGAAWRMFTALCSDRLRGPASSTDRVTLVQDYIRDNLAARTPVGELARLAGLSSSHFSTLFKSSTGIGVVEYRRRLRIARARELLLTTDEPVAIVAQAVGYDDAFYFTREFRAINGASPTEFRRRGGREQP